MHSTADHLEENYDGRTRIPKLWIQHRIRPINERYNLPISNNDTPWRQITVESTTA